MWITFDCATKRDALLSDNHVETSLHHTIEEAIGAFESGVRFSLGYEADVAAGRGQSADTPIRFESEDAPPPPDELAETLANFAAQQRPNVVCRATYLRHDTKDWHHVIMRVLPGIEGNTQLRSMW